ncbi:sodium/hydrogen exchanger 9B2-like [Dysidea avara]|uniref:sodium/hydrogen exchanger 9B2-like n=1 Tax=Dysidea avara TaxID=196820 RepID=UPI0033292E9D
MLGFVISAISPSILIPGLLNLQQHGFGTNKGIPSFLIASVSIDDVISISLFEILLGIEFSIGNIVFSIFRGPMEIVMGLVYGIGFGLVCWQIPHRHDMKKGTRNRNRLAIITGLAFFAYFGARRAKVYETGFISAGSLSVFVVAFVASIGWKRTGKTLVGRSLTIVWKFHQPLLLGLVGTDADFSAISIDLLAKGIGVLSIGVLVRTIAVLVALQGSKLNYKEKLFVVIAWLPRATVQTVVGSVAVDQAMRSGDPREEGFGRTLIAIAVLDIVIFGPIGALSIGLFGPHLLSQEGHHHVHIEHNIEGEVDITGKIESESESSEDEDDDEYETDDEPSYESLSRHMRDVQQLTSHAVADFHCCIDCDRLQDKLKFDCFRQMVDHDYVHNRHIHFSAVHHHCSGYSSESQSFKSVHSSVAYHHRSTHSLESDCYMSIQEEGEEEEVVTSPTSDTADISVAQLISHKQHSHHDHHHGHHHSQHHHSHHHGHHHGHIHGHHHHGCHHHGKHSEPYDSHSCQLQVKIERRRSCSPNYAVIHQETTL